MDQQMRLVVVKSVKLTATERKAIERLMKWEDDSWRSVMGTEPPRLVDLPHSEKQR